MREFMSKIKTIKNYKNNVIYLYNIILRNEQNNNSLLLFYTYNNESIFTFFTRETRIK